MAEDPKPEDEASPEVGDHPFEPRGKWWSLCKVCGLARAAHSSSTIDTRLEMFKEQMVRYGRINHVDPRKVEELEKEVRSYGYIGDTEVEGMVTGVPRHSYVGDDE